MATFYEAPPTPETVLSATAFAFASWFKARITVTVEMPNGDTSTMTFDRLHSSAATEEGQ